QIRVHMKYINHPIVGDPKYGSRRAIHMNGQALHAKELKFIHPVTGKNLHFIAPPPPEFQDFLTKLDKKSWNSGGGGAMKCRFFPVTGKNLHFIAPPPPEFQD